jgi:hypothetical protein
LLLPSKQNGADAKKTAAAARVVCLFLKIFNKKAIFKTII